jgi:RHS repeat-associated protein
MVQYLVMVDIPVGRDVPSRPKNGRVLNLSGTLKQEFVITDHQGNARVSFQDNGSGVAVVKQENSYYAFGLVMPNSPVATPTTPNKQLYNGGSEWQNDYGDLPNYYQTFYRNYDAATGRFIGVDPMAESAASMTPYQYANNNPVMNNDPLGDKTNFGQWVWDLYSSGQYGEHPMSEYKVQRNESGSSSFGGGLPGAYWPSGSTGVGEFFGRRVGENVNGAQYFMISTRKSYVYNTVTVTPGTDGLHMLSEFGVIVHTGYYYDDVAGNQGGNYDQYLAIFGVETTALENFAGKAQLGNGLKVYLPKASGRVFMGNQHGNTLGITKTAKVLGIIGVVVSTAIDGVGLYNNLFPTPENHDNRLSGAKFETNALFNGMGLFGGGIGALFSVGNSLINAYSPITIGDYEEVLQQYNMQNHFSAH